MKLKGLNMNLKGLNMNLKGLNMNLKGLNMNLKGLNTCSVTPLSDPIITGEPLLTIEAN